MALSSHPLQAGSFDLSGRNQHVGTRQGGSAPVYGHGPGNTAYERHQPEQTLLYQLVEAHYPALVSQLSQQGKSLPDHVHREFEAYLKCGRLEYGFLRVRCDKCHFERLVAFSCCLQRETMKSRGTRTRYSWLPPKESLLIVSDRIAKR